MLRFGLLLLCIHVIRAGTIPKNESTTEALATVDNFLGGSLAEQSNDTTGTFRGKLNSLVLDPPVKTPKVPAVKTAEADTNVAGAKSAVEMKTKGSAPMTIGEKKTVSGPKGGEASIVSSDKAVAPTGESGAKSVIATDNSGMIGTNEPDYDVLRQLEELLKDEGTIDPAVCKNCTGTDCVVEDMKSCEKFYRCIQGSEIGNTGKFYYIPVPKRCPSGTHWSVGLHTCSKPEENDPCPNEPCKLIPKLKAYKMQDKNCKTYYTCDDRGVSRARCCPDGMGFDQTRQNCSLSVQCDVLCPRLDQSVDICNTDMSLKDTPINDGNCRTYFKCRNMWSVGTCCPKGMKYVKGSDPQCVKDLACQTECPFTGDCRIDPKAKGFRYMDKCLHYIKCIDNEDGTGISKPMCCGNGRFYNDTSQICEQYIEHFSAEPECKDFKNETCMAGFFECGLEMGPSGPGYYRHWGSVLQQYPEMSCSDGTLFNEETCHCSLFNNVTYTCKKAIELKFDNARVLKNEAALGYIGVMTHNKAMNAKEQVNLGIFDRISAVNLPTLSYNQIGRFTVTMKFEDNNDDLPNERSIMFSNCRTNQDVNKASPSMEVALIRKDGQPHIEVLLTNSTSDTDKPEYVNTVLSLPYAKHMVMAVAVVYDGFTLKVFSQRQVKTKTGNFTELKPDPNSPPDVAEMPLTGTLHRAEQAGMLGACPYKRPSEFRNGFKGRIYSFVFAKCILESEKAEFEKFLQEPTSASP